MYIQGFPRRLSRKDSDCLTGDVSSIPGSGRTPGVENGNPFQYSCLGNLGRGLTVKSPLAIKITTYSQFQCKKRLNNSI